jgi:hypothetical protein
LVSSYMQITRGISTSEKSPTRAYEANDRERPPVFPTQGALYILPILLGQYHPNVQQIYDLSPGKVLAC